MSPARGGGLIQRLGVEREGVPSGRLAVDITSHDSSLAFSLFPPPRAAE